MILNQILIEYSLVFMRVGVCLMILPGTSAVQVAMLIRLYIAIGISIAIFFLVRGNFSISEQPSLDKLATLMFGEFFYAMILALPIRFMFLALSFFGEVITQMIGLNPIPGTPLGDDQSSTVLSSLFNLTALVLFFSTGLHLTFIMALAMSFSVYPPGELLLISQFVESITNDLGAFFNLVVRLAAPIIIYAVIFNLIAGLVNKLTPQIPIYFVSAPFLICGGIVLLTLVSEDILTLFIQEVETLILSR